MKQTLAVVPGFSFMALLSCVTCIGLPFISDVPDNTRQNFSLNFFRQINSSGLVDYVVSPAAVQKFLVVIYDAANGEIQYDLMHDLCVKIIEAETFMDIAESVKLRILRDEAHRIYFQDDFNDITSGLKIKNYIVGPNDFNRDFRIVAKEYFDVKTVNRLTKENQYAVVKHEFGNIVEDSDNLQIYSSIAFEASLKHSFNLEAGNLNGVGQFRCGTHGNLRIIELPLQTEEELILQIFLPSTEKFLTDFIEQFGKDFKHMNQYDDILSLKTVNVILPEINQQNVTDLGSYFKNHGFGAKRAFTDKYGITYAFEYHHEDGKFDSFWLKTKVHIKGPIAGDIPKGPHSGVLESEPETFDATEKSFIYFIKSKDILYFSGVHYN